MGQRGTLPKLWPHMIDAKLMIMGSFSHPIDVNVERGIHEAKAVERVP